MKKLLLTVIAALTMCGSTFAQAYESYWEFSYAQLEMQGALVASIAINGQIIMGTEANWDALEVAAFVGDDECRGNLMFLTNEYVLEYGDPYPILNGEPIFYTTPGDEVYFKMYDHMNEVLYETCVVTLEGEPFQVITGDDNMQGWFDPENPLILNFVTSEPEPDIIYWNDPDDWPNDSIPVVNVVIPENTEVIIPADYQAQANTIEMGANSVIIIEEGGELYHNDDAEITVGMNVNGYGEAKDGDVDGYRLVASPAYTDVANRSLPVMGTRMNTGNFDLYKFDQMSVHEEWVNYKQGEGYAPGFTDLFLGEGYLYANEENVRIMFNGHTLPTTAGDASIQSVVEGWNLLGNPFTCKAIASCTTDTLSDYYVMNAEGSDFITVEAAEYVVNPMQGIFVEARAAGQWITFTPCEPTGTGDPVEPTPGPGGGDDFKLNIRVNGNNGDYDVARIRFGQGRGLEKFMLNEDHTQIYFPVDNKNYAVTYAKEMGMMPVNFKAQNNGTYTISFNSKGNFNYLHLIDNMNGNDVDLLANPNYSFEAKTTDYATRFKLVFATGNNSNDDNFAFCSNGSFIINNEGKATLQVIDVNGRIVKSESINGSANVNVNAAPGVYMLRLVNGDNVKVQKVVIK